MFFNTDEELHLNCYNIPRSGDNTVHGETEAERDYKRMEFLEKDGTRHVYAIHGVWFFRECQNSAPLQMPTLRAAVDAARARPPLRIY